MGKKLPVVTSGAIGLKKTQPDSNPIKKKAAPITAPRGDNIICNRDTALLEREYS